MTDPLESLLVETEGIYLVMAGPGEPAGWHPTEDDARKEAEAQALSLRKPCFVFRAVAKVEPPTEAFHWTELAAHGPAR